MMKKTLSILSLLTLLAGCSFFPHKAEECIPYEKGEPVQYTQAQKAEKIQAENSMPFGYKDCRVEKLCTYKDCSKIENPDHICDNGQEYGHHFVRALEDKDMRLDYGEWIEFNTRDQAIFSGVEIEVKSLTGIIEITTEAFYTHQAKCWGKFWPLYQHNTSGEKLPPTISQYILTTGQSIRLGAKDLIVYTWLENLTFEGEYNLKINPIAKENRIAYKIHIPND